MLTFNLKKEWFEKIKSGEKTHEYRELKPYWTKRIYGNLPKDFKICFCLGYPHKDDKDKRVYANIIGIFQRINGINTDLKTLKPVIDIEFELIKEET